MLFPKKRYVMPVMLLAVLVLMAACAPPAPQQPAAPGEPQPEAPAPAPEVEQAPVVILQGIDPTTLDPYFRTQIPENNVMLGVFDVLVIWDEEGDVVPRVATEWEMVDDLIWEFKIREGIIAHNGEVIDAHAVAYSFERGVDPDVASRGVVPWLFGNIKYDRAEVVDDYTVRIHTSDPVSELPSYMKEMFVVPKGYYESTPLDEAARIPVGSGPYKFVEWVRGDHITLEANEDYWEGPPAAKQVIFRPVPETSARIAELNTGSADIIVNVPPDFVDQVDPNYGRVLTVEGLRRIFIGFVFYGPNAEAIQDKHVRQALNYGFDFQKIIDSLLSGNGQRTGTFANPPFQAPGVEPYPYDPDKALELLSEAGFEDLDGDGMLQYPDGRPLQLTLQTPSGRYVKDLELSQAIAGELRNIGVEVDVEITEWSIFAGQLGSSQLTGDMYLLGAGTGFNCQGDLSDWYSGTGWAPGKWLDAEFDTRFEEYIGTVDAVERERMCYELQEYMHEEVPLIFLYFQVDYYGVSNRLEWSPLANERIFVYDIKFAHQ